MHSEYGCNHSFEKMKLQNFWPKSICAVEMTMYVDWACMNVNGKDVHA